MVNNLYESEYIEDEMSDWYRYIMRNIKTGTSNLGSPYYKISISKLTSNGAV